MKRTVLLILSLICFSWIIQAQAQSYVLGSLGEDDHMRMGVGTRIGGPFSLEASYVEYDRGTEVLDVPGRGLATRTLKSQGIGARLLADMRITNVISVILSGGAHILKKELVGDESTTRLTYSTGAGIKMKFGKGLAAQALYEHLEDSRFTIGVIKEF